LDLEIPFLEILFNTETTIGFPSLGWNRLISILLDISTASY